MYVRTLPSFATALNRFNVLLLVPPEPEVLAEIKRTVYIAFYPLILRLKVSHNFIEHNVYYGLAATLYYFLNKEKKEIDRSEDINVVKGGRRQGACPLPKLKCHQ